MRGDNASMVNCFVSRASYSRSSLLPTSESSASIAFSLPPNSPAIASISSATRVTSSVTVSSVRMRSLTFRTMNSSTLGAFR